MYFEIHHIPAGKPSLGSIKGCSPLHLAMDIVRKLGGTIGEASDIQRHLETVKFPSEKVIGDYSVYTEK